MMSNQFQGNLKNILEEDTLRWIFVGGKGGVGKTTTSSSLATALAGKGKKTLIISTDPAHNLSDCFNQKISKSPNLVQGIDNLYAMEIQSKVDIDKMNKEYDLLKLASDEGTKNLLNQILSSVPGIDEAMSFSQLINSIQKMDFDVIVFDTAPTGHTLRFLNFPSIIQKGLNKLLTLKQKFGAMMSGMGSLFGSQQQLNTSLDKIFSKLETMQSSSKEINIQMKDSTKTTFVAVCIPQFLSMYETQRLIQQLTKFQIDIHNIVINQVLYPEDSCKMCIARGKMQKKYLDQIIQLYEDFHITLMPLQEEEVRGSQKLQLFSKLLLQQKKLPS